MVGNRRNSKAMENGKDCLHSQVRQNIENLRSISLTSCLGKLLELMVLNTLDQYVSEHHLLPDVWF